MKLRRGLEIDVAERPLVRLARWRKKVVWVQACLGALAFAWVLFEIGGLSDAIPLLWLLSSALFVSSLFVLAAVIIVIVIATSVFLTAAILLIQSLSLLVLLALLTFTSLLVAFCFLS